MFFDIPGVNGVTIHACRLGDVSRRSPVVLEWTNYILDDPNSYPAAGCPPQLKGLAAELVHRGYVYVAAQTRGVGASTGTAQTWSVQDGKDGAAVVEWIARQRWSTGHVGLAGCSSSAQEGLQVLVQSPPHLGAAALACFAPDSFRDAIYPGGMRSYSVLPVASRPLIDLDPVALRTRLDRGDGAALLTESAGRLAADAAFEAGIVSTDTDGAFWADRSTTLRLNERRAPVLAFGSWADFFLRGTTEWERTRRPADRLVLLPGWHGAPVEASGRYGMTARAAAYFDQHLRDLPDSYHGDQAVVWWEQPGGQVLDAVGAPDPSRFRQSTDWPPRETGYQVLALKAPDTTGLLARPSLAPEATTDPRGLGTGSRFTLQQEAQGAVATWTFPATTKPLHLAGPVALRLRVSPLTPELDIYARLVAIAPDNTFRDITNGWLRGSQAALDPRRTERDPRTGTIIRPFHRHDATTPLAVGTPIDLDVELWQTAAELPTGTRLRLVVTAEDTPWTLPSGTVELGQVLAGGHLVLPVMAESTGRVRRRARPAPARTEGGGCVCHAGLGVRE